MISQEINRKFSHIFDLISDAPCTCNPNWSTWESSFREHLRDLYDEATELELDIYEQEINKMAAILDTPDLDCSFCLSNANKTTQ